MQKLAAWKVFARHYSVLETDVGVSFETPPAVFARHCGGLETRK